MPGSYVTPFSRDSFSATAWRRTISPRLSGYRVRPPFMARVAASMMCGRRIEVGLAAHQRDDRLPAGLRLSDLGEDSVDGGGPEERRPAGDLQRGQGSNSTGLRGGAVSSAVKRQCGDRQQLRELCDGPRAGDGSGNRGPVAQPGERHRGNRRVVSGGNVVERGKYSLPACVEIFPRPFGSRAFNRASRPILPGQESHGEREVRHACHALARADIGQGAFVFVPDDQVVVRLQRNVAGEAFARRCRKRRRQPRGGEVGGGDVAHLAFAHERVEFAKRFLDRRVEVVGVRVIQVDAIDAETLQ